LLEAPVLAALLSFIIKSSNNIDQEYTLSMNENVPAYIFMLIIVALFVGLTISAEEIFKDQKILKREKFLQLSRLSYLKSKAIYLILLSVLQSLLLCGVGNLIIELNVNLYE
jgi:ABC transport system ATP-binding/permease protein